jgi:FKBP-type peptidyl-prolyl cis-trans isomerase 2
MRIKILVLVLSLFSFIPSFAAKKAKQGDRVAVKYTGKLKDGRVFDHNVDKQDLIFTIGDSNLIKSFDQAFIGMKEGETKTIEIPAKDAYGEFKEDMLFKIPAEQLPKGTKVGDTLKYRLGGGFHPVRIIHIGEKEVYIDANHNLAGKDLTFEIKLLDILKPEKKKEEKS